MATGVLGFIRKLLPLSEQDRFSLTLLRAYLPADDLMQIEGALKQKSIRIVSKDFGLSSFFGISSTYPVLEQLETDPEIAPRIGTWNAQVRKRAFEGLFREFSSRAPDVLCQIIAPHILGLEHIKKAVVLQLFATERVHFLLIGDPGVGKTDILRSAAALHPCSAFGLGSGTSGVGLSLTMRGQEVLKGLLPLADGGICAIDELNLMKEESRASLYNAMEKGFVSYNKGGKHIQLPAHVRVLATANPRGDRFKGYTLSRLKLQLPFDIALLSRFHLMFVLRKPTPAEFEKIAQQLTKPTLFQLKEADLDFIKAYVAYAEARPSVVIPSKVHEQIVTFSVELKKHEAQYLVEISPRFVLGIIRLVKARALLELRTTATLADLTYVESIVRETLALK